MNGRQQMAKTSAKLDVQEVDGWKEFRKQGQRKDWKDSAWPQKNGDWESEHVIDVKKPIHTYKYNELTE
jgi:hypothetical protein